MHIRWFLVVCLLFPCALFADPPCDPRAVLEAHLDATNTPNDTLVLARNHLGGWVGGRWNGTNIVSDDGFANLHLVEPSVTVGTTDQLHVYVINTNPLAYTGVQSGGELVDRADLADLRQIIGLLANVGTSALQIQAQRNASASVWNRTFQKSVDAQARVQASVERNVAPRPIDELDAIAGAVIDRVEQTSKQIDIHVTNIKTAAMDVEEDIDRADKLNSDAILFVTRVEAGDATEPRITVDSQDDNLPASMTNAFEKLSSTAQALDRVPLSCPAAVAAAAAAVDRKIVGLGEDADAQLTAIREYRSNLTEVAGETVRCSPEMARVLNPLRQWLARNEPGATAVLDPQRATLIDLHIALQSYAAIDTARSEALTKAEEANAKRGTAVRTATAFLDLRNRFNTAFVSKKPCALTNGVIEIRRFLLTNVDQPFTKDGKETFKVTVDSRFAEEALRHDAELEASYAVVARRKFDIDFDFAAIYTNLSDPTFGTETIVIEEAHDDQPAKTELRITRKDEATRAGQVALMASFRGNLFGFDTNPLAFQVGAGLSTEKPALFTGVAYQLGRYVKLSTGWTFQKVTRLADGLHEGDVVPNEDAVRTRDAFADKWYAAISITLDDIDFFRPQD